MSDPARGTSCRRLRWMFVACSIAGGVVMTAVSIVVGVAGWSQANLAAVRPVTTMQAEIAHWADPRWQSAKGARADLRCFLRPRLVKSGRLPGIGETFEEVNAGRGAREYFGFPFPAMFCEVSSLSIALNTAAAYRLQNDLLDGFQRDAWVVFQSGSTTRVGQYIPSRVLWRGVLLNVSAWGVISAFVLWFFGRLRQFIRRSCRESGPRCRRCGYPALSAVPGCPECGLDRCPTGSAPAGSRGEIRSHLHTECQQRRFLANNGHDCVCRADWSGSRQ